MTEQNIFWGISPIGWRNDDLPEIGKENTISHVLSDMAVAGFQGTEVGGFFPTSDVLNRELKLRNLRIAGQWFSSFLIRDGLASVSAAFRSHCQYLSDVEADVAVVSEQTYSIQGGKQNVFSDKPMFSDDEWDVLSSGLNQLGTIAQEYGLKLVYHHHMGTGVQTVEEVDRLMASTDSERVFLLYDTGHIYVSDGDLLSLLRRHLSRIRHVHFKDVRDDVMNECKRSGNSFMASVLSGLFTVPGDGSIDFLKPYQALCDAGYQGWIVIEAEQDPTKAHPLEYALKARRYIDAHLR